MYKMNLFLELNPPDCVQLYPRGIIYIYIYIYTQLDTLLSNLHTLHVSKWQRK